MSIDTFRMEKTSGMGIFSTQICKKKKNSSIQNMFVKQTVEYKFEYYLLKGQSFSCGILIKVRKHVYTI